MPSQNQRLLENWRTRAIACEVRRAIAVKQVKQRASIYEVEGEVRS
ncbi:MAG: hypothetical protein QNJ72_23445 [Pleurocapsa sp. MO_226.B13]|nr:hypothetical protein [Pleurocapsa sp. MO_226.B13]